MRYNLTALSCYLVITFTVCFTQQTTASTSGDSTACREITVYSKQSCPYCRQATQHIDSLQQTLPGLVVHYRDIVKSLPARQEFLEKVAIWEMSKPSVPTIEVCDRVFVGFDQNIAREINQLVGLTQPSPEQASTIVLPVFGELDHKTLGLPAFTIAVGLADGFNPCATWILLFILSLLVNLKDRRRMALIAGTFVVISGVIYFAFMAAWLNALLIIGYSRALQLFLAAIALLIGLVNIKDYFFFQRGPSLHIPDSAKPGLYRRMRAVISAENTAAALFSVSIMAISVNFIELLCTAGLPAIYTSILTKQQLSTASYYGYLALYNIAYIIDDSIMVAIAVITLSRQKLQQQHGRLLKLISGLMITALGILLIIEPNWLF